MSRNAVLVAGFITMLFLNLALIALVAWVFSVTGSAWSFALLLFFFHFNAKDKE